jgi:PPOX class probable F420-dependent enzyme
MATLNAAARALVDGKNTAVLATVEPDGRPQQSAVWVTRDGDDVIFSTLAGRRKHSNLVRDPRATLLILDAGNPYHYVEIRGTSTHRPCTGHGGVRKVSGARRARAGRGFPGDVLLPRRRHPDRPQGRSR